MDAKRSLVRVLTSPTAWVAGMCCLFAHAAGAEGALVNLGTLNGGYASSASAVNATGSVVVGDAADGTAQNKPRAFRWTQASGMVSLGALTGDAPSWANGVSANGLVVVGGACTDTGLRCGLYQQAFRWTQATGMVSLGNLSGGASIAHGVSADGSVVVGYSDGRAFRWTSKTGMVSLGEYYSSAKGVSADGSVVVGESEAGHFAGLQRRAWCASARSSARMPTPLPPPA
jgi:probable HAF family extracellular repeat protein